MSKRFWERTIAFLASLSLATISLLSPSGLTAIAVNAGHPAAVPSVPEQSGSAKDKDFRCVKLEASAKPPPRRAPKLYTKTKEYEKIPTPSQTPAFKPVCPEGQVPISTSAVPLRFQLEKGNPLIGHVKGEQEAGGEAGQIRAELIRKSLRPFKEVYWKGRGQGTDNRGKQSHAGQSRAPLFLDPLQACDGVPSFGSCYYYASAGYQRQADGGGMTMSIERPQYITSGRGGHTLDEIAVQGGQNNGNIIELGWNVSTEQYGDANPHLFVFHWRDWTGTCYDGCGWQQYSRTYFPRMDLSQLVGRQVYVGFVFYEGNWWAWFDNQWLGYFPGSEWGGNYTRNELIQWFGEVSSSNGVPPRTDMGNGLFPPPPNAATNFTLCDVDARAWVCWYRDEQSLGSTVPRDYDIARTGFGSTRYGGPGE